MKILISGHALFRLIERCSRHGLDIFEARKCVFEAVKRGELSKTRHKAKQGRTYYSYFANNLGFYVICAQRDDLCLIKTIIIESGRR